MPSFLPSSVAAEIEAAEFEFDAAARHASRDLASWEDQEAIAPLAERLAALYEKHNVPEFDRICL